MSKKDRYRNYSVDEENGVGDEIKKYNRRLFEKKDRKQLYIAGAVLVAFVVGMFANSGISGYAVADGPGDQAVGERVVSYINNNQINDDEQATLVSVTRISGLYQITIIYQGNQINVFATLDGKYVIIGGLIDLDEPVLGSSEDTGTGL